MIAYLMISVFPAALIVAAANDIYEFKIPNWVSLVLVGAYPLAGVALGAPASVIFEGLLVGAGGLALGFALFAGRIVGGGDAKLFAATTPWIGLAAMGEFLLYTAVAGFFLAIAMSMFRKLPILPVYSRAPWLIELHGRAKDLPYAVALGAGGFLSFSQTPLFQLAFGG